MTDEKIEHMEKLKQVDDILMAARMKRKDRSTTRFNRRLRSYLIVNGFLFIINLITYRGTWWFIWPALGWGLLILMRFKKTSSAAPGNNAGFGSEDLLQKSQSHTSGTGVNYLKIQVEPGNQSRSEEKINVRVPLTALKAGVNLSSFLPHHTSEKVNEALKSKGLNFDLSSLTNGEFDLFVSSLSELNIVVEQDDTKVVISCE
jgi:hypothetical protein